VRIAIFIDRGDNLINEHQTADTGLLSRLGSHLLPAIGATLDRGIIPLRRSAVIPIVGG
jgi:hypothetical protein